MKRTPVEKILNRLSDYQRGYIIGRLQATSESLTLAILNVSMNELQQTRKAQAHSKRR